MAPIGEKEGFYGISQHCYLVRPLVDFTNKQLRPKVTCTIAVAPELNGTLK
jgi:hypothetical protein